jgi:UPF0755 protein
VSRGRKPATKQRGVSPLRRLVIALVSGLSVFVLIAVLVLGVGVFLLQGPGPKAKSGERTVVELRHGASLPEIGSTLKRAGVIRSSSVFVTAAQVTGAARRLKAGEYEFASREPIAQILADIRDGRIVRHQVTIAEGLTSEMVVELLAKEPLLTGVAPTPAEGVILPETYQFERGEDRAKVLRRMIDAQDKLLAVLWARRQPGLPYLTPTEAVTLASIVEKETGKADERPRVAAVFINRLRTGMRLQSDPTVIYGVSQGRPLGRGLLASELADPNPYNTYAVAGLPPGPIANPGRAALAAVLDPPRTAELYFVADGTGGHAFATSLEQHAKNVERWRAIERKAAAAK